MRGPGDGRSNWRSRYWVARGRLMGIQIERSTRTSSLEKAKEFVDGLIKTNGITLPPCDLDGYSLKRVAQKLYSGAQYRAKIRALPINITKADVDALLTASGGRCEVSGVELSYKKFNASRRAPFSPSIDRIIPSLGYVVGNCRIVACCVNAAMGEWGQEVFKTIVATIAEKYGRK